MCSKKAGAQCKIRIIFVICLFSIKVICNVNYNINLKIQKSFRNVQNEFEDKIIMQYKFYCKNNFFQKIGVVFKTEWRRTVLVETMTFKGSGGMWKLAVLKNEDGG